MFGFFRKTVSPDSCETLMLISQAVRSGLPLAEAVRLSLGNSLAQTGTDRLPPEMRAFEQLTRLLEKGVEPQTAVRQSGLPPMTAELFAVALKTGNFADTFDEMTRLETNRVLTIRMICQALAYPVFLLAGTLIVLLIFFGSIAPQFKKIFMDFGMDVPYLTSTVLHVSDAVRDGSFLIGVAVFIGILLVGIRLFFPRFLFCIPIFGAIGRSMVKNRILSQMAFFVSLNIPLDEALEKCGRTVRNRAYRKDCLSAAEAAKRGMLFQEIVHRFYWLFPAWLAPMIAQNDSPETLTRSLRRAAETVDIQKETSLQLLQILSLPLFVFFITSTVLVSTIAMFMPLIKLITSLSSPM
ncbi:MAG: type II secretion system F family protein [Planctomycetaceae bacterium]|jgi:general secretion pathway protein F|nr:type II secretion system F family protein [Planctomycetaceae bacterium]